MAAHLECQGEAVVLLAIMDSVPCIEKPAAEERDEDDTIFIKWFANRTKESVPDLARPYIDKAPQVIRWLSHLAYNHSPLSYSGGIVLFRAMVQEDPARQPFDSATWQPYAREEIEVYDIDCKLEHMDQPGPLADIGRVLAQKLNEIHVDEAREE